MAKKEKQTESNAKGFTPTITNKKAHFNFVIMEKFEAGLVLVGTEVKSLRQGTANLEDAFGRIRGTELFLIGANIPIYTFGTVYNHEPKRVRKLLVHKGELKKIESKLAQKGYTLVPLRIYFTHGLAKIEMALAKGKTHGDKREKLRDREHARDMRKATYRKR